MTPQVMHCCFWALFWTESLYLLSKVLRLKCKALIRSLKKVFKSLSCFPAALEATASNFNSRHVISVEMWLSPCSTFIKMFPAERNMPLTNTHELFVSGTHQVPDRQIGYNPSTMLWSIQQSASNWVRPESLPRKASKSRHLPWIPLLISSRRSPPLSVCAKLHEKKQKHENTKTRISWFPSLLATMDWAAGHSCSRTNLSQHPPQLLDMPLQRVVVAKHGGRLHSRRTCPRQWTL